MLGICYRPSTDCARLVTRSALQSRKWQLIGMSKYDTAVNYAAIRCVRLGAQLDLHTGYIRIATIVRHI